MTDKEKEELTKEEISQVLIVLSSWKRNHWFAGEKGNERLENATVKLEQKLED